MNSASKTKWPCRICSKYLSSKRSYDEHMNIHNESRPFACDQCDYSAASQMTLRRHKLRNHIPRHAWGYQCPYCGEAYMEPASYQQHVLTRHFGRSATFGCPHGGCTFTTKSSKHFREHVKKHIFVMSVRTPSKYFSLQSNFNISKHLIDDELGSGYGKEALIPVAHRVSVTKRPLNSEISSLQKFMIADKDFLKTPMDLNSVRLRASVNPISSTKQPSLKKITDETNYIEYTDISTSISEKEPLNKKHEDDRRLTKSNDSTKFDVVPSDNIDWIETEIVIDNVPTHQLPNGLADMELD